MKIIDSTISAARGLFSRALNFYNGLVPASLKVRAGEPDDNVYINYAQIIVDKGVAFLFGKSLKISVGTDEDRSGEKFLEKVWSQAQRDEELQEMAQDAASAGDAYLKINIEPTGLPRVTVGDPDRYRIITDPHDVSRVRLYRCSYELTDPATGKPYLFKEETSRAEDGKSWIIQQYESRDNGKTWQAVGESVTWNFAFAPIFHCKNLPQPKSPYGKPDLTKAVLDLIGYISRLDSMCGKTVRIHSSPKPWARGIKKQDLQWGTDGMLFLGNGLTSGTQSVAAEIGMLEMKGDLAGALAYRKVLREGLSEMTGVPEVATGKVESTGQLSGVALRILYGPLIELTEKKQLRFGRMIKECAEALLAIGRITGAVVLHWTDPLPGDEKAKVEVAEGKKRIGFSEDTLIRELGGNPEQEREKRQLDVADTGAALLSAFDRGTGAEQLAA
ncbi:MAG: phage portal protein [Pyrinomonadaceae bacterium]